MISLDGSRTALLGLGGNLGDVLMAFRGAAERLARDLGDVSLSAVYRTPPEGGVPQPPYLNAVARVETTVSPSELLQLVGVVESAAGRKRPSPGAARSLDVDILFLGDLIVSSTDLTLPHPRWSSRDFVVVPLLDVAPEWVDPITGRAVQEIADEHGWSSDRFTMVAPGAVIGGGREPQ